jgi:peptide subunit release factor RF-3
MDLFEVARELRKHESLTFCSDYIREHGLEQLLDALMDYSPHPAIPLLKVHAKELDTYKWESSG